MRKYTVYFEMYGKKMKTSVMAQNIEHAKWLVTNQIVFHKVVPIVEQQDDVEFLKDFFGFK